MYSNPNISHRAVGLALGGAVLTFVFSFLTWAVYPRKAGEEEVKKGGEVGVEGAPHGDDDVTEEGGLDMRPTKRTSMTRIESCRSDEGMLDVTKNGRIDEAFQLGDNDVANGNKWQVGDIPIDRGSMLSTNQHEVMTNLPHGFVSSQF